MGLICRRSHSQSQRGRWIDKRPWRDVENNTTGRTEVGAGEETVGIVGSLLPSTHSFLCFRNDPASFRHRTLPSRQCSLDDYSLRSVHLSHRPHLPTPRPDGSYKTLTFQVQLALPILAPSLLGVFDSRSRQLAGEFAFIGVARICVFCAVCSEMMGSVM